MLVAGASQEEEPLRGRLGLAIQHPLGGREPALGDGERPRPEWSSERMSASRAASAFPPAEAKPAYALAEADRIVEPAHPPGGLGELPEVLRVQLPLSTPANAS